jgi:hypothetical protein
MCRVPDPNPRLTDPNLPVLASPAFRVKLYVPFARSGLRIMHTLRGNSIR